MNFPLFEKHLEASVAKCPTADLALHYGWSICEMRAQLDTFAGSLYLCKLYKHRPEVKKAGDTTVMSSRAACISTISSQTKSYAFARRWNLYS